MTQGVRATEAEILEFESALEAVQLDHNHELAKLRMQLVRYRLLLEEHGIEPPDDEGEELLQMWRDCRQVIETAHEFVVKLKSSKELLDEAWRTPPARLHATS